MPSTTLRPSANGSIGEWDNDDYTRLSDDSDATYMNKVDDTAARTLFAMPDLPAGAVVVDTVTAYYRMKRTAANATAQTLAQFYINPDYSSGTARTAPDAITTYSDVIANAPGQSGWTPAQWNSVEFGAYKDAGVRGDEDIYVYDLWAIIAYKAGGATLIALILSILGSLGSNLHLSDMPGLISLFNRAQREHFIHGNEAVDLFKAIRAEKYRRYLFLAA